MIADHGAVFNRPCRHINSAASGCRIIVRKRLVVSQHAVSHHAALQEDPASPPRLIGKSPGDVVGDEAALNESSSRPDRSAIGHPRSLPVAIPQGQILKNRIRMHHDKQPGQGGSPPFDGRPFRTGATDRKAAPHDHRFSHDPERAHPQSNLASALGRIDGRLHLGGRLGRRVIGRRGRSTKIHVQHRRM